MKEEGIIRKIDWSIDPAKMQSTLESTIEKAEQHLDEIAKTPEGEENLQSLLDFEEIGSAAEEVLSPLAFIKYVSTDKAQRDAADEVEKESLKFANKIYGRNDLYKVLARLEPIADSFGEEEQVLLDKTLKDFRRRGAALDDAERMEFLEIANNITVLESEFGRVLNEITTTVPCSKEELEGVPPSIYEELEKDDEGRYLLPLDYPVSIPVTRYAKNPKTRRRMTLALARRGGKENCRRLSDTLALRDRQAKLLGFKTFAEYEISRKMAKVPERVFEFENDLVERLTPLSEKELEDLRALKAKELGISIDDANIEMYDLAYYHHMLMREKYSVDQNEVKKYFPMERVVEGVLNVYQTVLDLVFKEVKTPDVWAEDVRQFEVYDKKTKNLLGVFNLDLYPREGKFKHYAVFPILGRRIKDGTALLPYTSMVANFQKPSKAEPSLLTHDEVVTFFHEFGHLMHVISNQASYATFGLDAVLPDFIETPSQMLENWAWQEEILNDLSGHYEDSSKKLPKDILKKMIEAKLLNIGTLTLRQVFYGLIDMTYNTETVEDTTAAYLELLEKITGFTYDEEDITPEAGFGHLMGGYAAGYYSYLWSKVYAEDLFTRFEKEGVMNEKVGLEYRQMILAPGGSKDPDVMVKEFLGREPNSDAFMKSLGIGK
jgi:Zn-dependent oligopeptidase